MEEYYSPADFIRSPKYDAHIHYHTSDDLLVRSAVGVNLHLLTINTDFDVLPIRRQFEIAQSLHRRHPQAFNFIGTFDASAFASPTFAKDTIRQIEHCVKAGAGGIKIWKNVGMSLQTEAGQYLMADDLVFDPIYAFLEKEKVALLAHLGEPRNCWLPLEEITICSDLDYFGKSPQYHMHRHPEAPSYERQIAAQDHILERYPSLVFVGAHLACMEWSLEELSKRLDRFPNLQIDLSGRFPNLFEQAFRNRAVVIDFFKTYQDRIMYGLDYFISPDGSQRWMRPVCRCFPRAYMRWLFKRMLREVEKHWLFLATDQIIETGKILVAPVAPRQIQGINLPKDTVDRIFYRNACRIYQTNSND
jgi:hypothetical protein